MTEITGLARDNGELAPVVKRLLRKIPRQLIKQRPGGGKSYSYVPWSYYARELTEVFGPYWSFEQLGELERYPLPDIPAKGNKPPQPREEVMVRMRIVTPTNTMEAVGSHIYYPMAKDSTLGDIVQAAQSFALKRAASRMGIGLDLYGDSEDVNPPDLELEDAQAAWRSKLKQLGLPEKMAIMTISERMTGDDTALVTMQDVLDATGRTGSDSYWELMRILEQVEEAKD